MVQVKSTFSERIELGMAIPAIKSQTWSRIRHCGFRGLESFTVFGYRIKVSRMFWSGSRDGPRCPGASMDLREVPCSNGLGALALPKAQPASPRATLLEGGRGRLSPPPSGHSATVSGVVHGFSSNSNLGSCGSAASIHQFLAWVQVCAQGVGMSWCGPSLETRKRNDGERGSWARPNLNDKAPE
jgi:hypothetical protein